MFPSIRHEKVHEHKNRKSEKIVKLKQVPKCAINQIANLKGWERPGMNNSRENISILRHLHLMPKSS